MNKPYDQTGRKTRTFVAANGTTLAVQALGYAGGTTTEYLSFLHQDASGTGAQHTNAAGTLDTGGNARTAEYAPLGRNVAEAAPYITLDTIEPSNENGSNINLYDTGDGYRPGRQSYKIDGIAVSESRFMMEIDSGFIGGAFGLLQMSARMSVSRYLGSTFSVDSRFGNTNFGTNGQVFQLPASGR